MALEAKPDDVFNLGLSQGLKLALTGLRRAGYVDSAYAPLPHPAV